MSAHLRYLRYAVVDSFWFVPGLLLLVGLGLVVLSTIADWLLQPYWTGDLNWVVWVDPNGAREILSVIAGSMIGATSLVFSITIVTLTLASQQLGPRLLAIFRGDRMTQVALGTFVATLAYALLTLRLPRLEGSPHGEFVPLASVTIAQLLTILSLAVLIFFIHHLAQLLESDTIVSHVGDGLDENVRALFPEESRLERSTEAKQVEAALTQQACRVVRARRYGYVQTIARQKLIDTAQAEGGRIELLVMPGHFVVAGQPLAHFWPKRKASDELSQRIAAQLAIGPKRTQAEDLEYAANALVEIALRALSPSLNDPFTAIACVNRLGASLALAVGRHDPPLRQYDDEGELRLLMPQRGFIDLLESSFDDIRGSAVEHPSVLRSMLRILISLADLAADPARRAAIQRQGEAIRRAMERHLPEPLDRHSIESYLARLEEQLRRWEDPGES